MGNGGSGDNDILGAWGTWAIGAQGAMGYRGYGAHGHIGIIMHRSRWGTVVMGHMGNGVHG